MHLGCLSLNLIKMTMVTLSRKQFLRRVGIGAGIALFTPVQQLMANQLNESNLDTERIDFLIAYEQWLVNFQQFVEQRNRNPLDVENNLRLMELSKQAEVHKPVLEKYMKNPEFASYFNEITKRVSQSIQ